MNAENESNKSVTHESTDSKPTPIRDSLDRFFDDDSLWDPSQFFRAPRFGGFGRRLFPQVDVRETDTMVRVVADVPGVEPENINVEVIGNRMTISGYVERGNVAEDEKSYRNERLYGEFRREFTLPARVKEQEIKAVHKGGVLTITMPKKDDEIRKRVPIERE